MWPFYFLFVCMCVYISQKILETEKQQIYMYKTELKPRSWRVGSPKWTFFKLEGDELRLAECNQVVI